MENTAWDEVRLRQRPALRALHGPLRLRTVGRAGRQQAAGRQSQNAPVATELMSADTAITVPCVVFALRRESMYFRRAFRFQNNFPGSPGLARFRGPRKKSDLCIGATALLLETGVGAAAMETALRWCLSGPLFGRCRIGRVSCYWPGFPERSGGAALGDLVAATEIVDDQGQCWPAIPLKEWAEFDLAAGRLLTMPELIADPREKQRLGRQYEALAVDMESTVAARLCFQNKVPFACLRVISDDCQTPLSPHLLDLLRQGRVSLLHLAASVLRHPKLIGELRRLASQTRQAARRLLGPLSAVATVRLSGKA